MHLKYLFLFLFSFTCPKSIHLFAQEQDGSKHLEIAERRSIPPKMRTGIKHVLFHTSRYLYRTYQLQDGIDTVFEEAKYREVGPRGKHIKHYFEGEGMMHFETYQKNAKITGWAKLGKVYCALFFVGSMLNAINPGDVDFVHRDRRRAVIYAGLTVGAELLIEKHSKLERKYLDKAVSSYNGLSQTSMIVPSQWHLGFRYNPIWKTPMIRIVFSY